MYLFMHSFVGEHLGCFCILALVNNAAVNIGMNKTFQISVFISSDIHPIVELWF